jgi:hypothetical protein
MARLITLWQQLDAWCEKYLAVYNPYQGGW